MPGRFRTKGDGAAAPAVEASEENA
jgi:hypothetical protein